MIVKNTLKLRFALFLWSIASLATVQRNRRRLQTRSPRGLPCGGGSGQVINKDKPGSSRLLKSVQYDDSDLQMPPDGKLPQEQIDVLQRWILMAYWPADTRTEQVIRSHLPLKN